MSALDDMTELLRDLEGVLRGLNACLPDRVADASLDAIFEARVGAVLRVFEREAQRAHTAAQHGVLGIAVLVRRLDARHTEAVVEDDLLRDARDTDARDLHDAAVSAVREFFDGRVAEAEAEAHWEQGHPTVAQAAYAASRRHLRDRDALLDLLARRLGGAP